MKKAVLILFVCDLSFLIVGSVLAIPFVRSNLGNVVIRNFGTIVSADDSSSETTEASSLQQTNGQTSLEIIGYFTILASMGFFATGLVMMRKRN